MTKKSRRGRTFKLVLTDGTVITKQWKKGDKSSIRVYIVGGGGGGGSGRKITGKKKS
jgi:hypothetical protein